MTSTKLQRRWSAQQCVAAILSLALVGANGGQLTVPDDSSLTLTDYYDLGVPALDDPWNGEEHRDALSVLATVERRHLPRHNSARSGELFERLVATQSALVEWLWGKAGASANTFQQAESIPALSRLYAHDRSDGLLFDRELLEIYSEMLSNRIAALEELDERDRKLQEMTADDDANEARETVGDLQRKRAQLRSDLEDLCIVFFARIIGLAEIEETSSSTRVALSNRLNALALRAAPHLSEPKLRALGGAIHEIAELEENKQILRELLTLSQELGPHQVQSQRETPDP